VGAKGGLGMSLSLLDSPNQYPHVRCSSKTIIWLDEASRIFCCGTWQRDGSTRIAAGHRPREADPSRLRSDVRPPSTLRQSGTLLSGGAGDVA